MTTPDPQHDGTRRFGRVEQYDDRNQAYGITAHLEAAGAATAPVTHSWETPTPTPLDQGNTSHCVPFAGVHHRIAAPVETPGQSNNIAHALYARCKAVDGLGDGVDGTSVLAIAKVFRADGVISEFRWCTSEPELALAVSLVCPVVIGVRWRAGMMDPDHDGYLHPTGASVGGHCVLVVGVNVEAGFYEVLCAWGRWGYDGKGRARISRTDMAALLANGGDACVLIEHPLNDPPVPTPPAPPHRPRHPRRWAWPFNHQVPARR